MPQHRHRGRHRRAAPRLPRALVPGTAAAAAVGLALAGFHAPAHPAERAVAATAPVPLPAFAPSPLVQPLDVAAPAPRHPILRQPVPPAVLRWRSTPWTPPAMPKRAPTASQRRAYDAVARQVDARIAGCDLTGTVLAAVTYVDHATHSALARTAEPTAVALCAAGTHLDRSDALTLALYRYADSGAYARAVLAIVREYGPA